MFFELSWQFQQTSSLIRLARPLTVYDDWPVSAEFTKQADGRYQIHLTVEAKKFRADGRGQEPRGCRE